MASARRPRSYVTPILTLLALGGGLACSAILAPRDDVQRCGSVDDCEATGDARYVAECVSDPEANIDTTRVDQICVASFRTVGCNPMDFDEEHPYRVAFEGPLVSSERYSCADTPGVRGCPQIAGGGCAEGLVVNANNVCDDPDADVPSINMNAFSELDGQDVLDQFCAGYFCDEEFVCDTTSFGCVKCDPDLPFGEGGCGTVYTQGTPSCVYRDADEDECSSRDSSATPGEVSEDIEFGCEG